MESGSLKFSLLSVMYENRLMTQGYTAILTDPLCLSMDPNNDQST